MDLRADLERIAAAAGAMAGPGEALVGVIPTEPEPGERMYLCAFEGAARTWVTLDDEGRPIGDRRRVRSSVAIAALCELAEESAGGGNLEELRSQLAELRGTERAEGLAAVEEAVGELERTLGTPPRLASPAHLDAIGAATRRLEEALGRSLRSPFLEVMSQAAPVVEELEREVVDRYRGALG